eukprot:3849472-Pyramimonas_sp.AAC.1
MDTDDVLFVAWDLPEDVVLGEHEATAIYANYSQARQCLYKRALGRGPFKLQPPKGMSEGSRAGKRRGKRSGHARPKWWANSKSMSRSRFRRLPSSSPSRQMMLSAA